MFCRSETVDCLETQAFCVYTLSRLRTTMYYNLIIFPTGNNIQKVAPLHTDFVEIHAR